MSSATIIEAQERAKSGTGTARAIRREGMIPAIVYGNKIEPEMIAVDSKQIFRESQSAAFFSTLYTLKVNNNTQRVLVKDIQIHPVKDTPLHVDFMRVNKDSKVSVFIPIHYINEEKSPAIKRGGLLNIIAHNLETVCPAENIPEFLVVDLNGLEMHQSVQLSNIKFPEGCKAAHAERDAVLATVVAPAGEEKASEESGV
jgi:large subunit ribosomal protein L25